MIIVYSKEEEKLLPGIERETKQMLKRKKKEKELLKTGEIIKVKNNAIKDPGIILFVDTDIVSKYRYLIANIKDKQAHWYSREEVEVVKDEKTKKAVLEWYRFNQEILKQHNKEKIFAI